MNWGHSHDIKLLHLADADWKPNVSSPMDMDVFLQADRKKNTIENHKASQGFKSGGKVWRFFQFDPASTACGSSELHSSLLLFSS